MSGRAVVATLLLLALGVGAGFAASYAASSYGQGGRSASGTAAPLPAESPGVPGEPVRARRADPTEAPLATGLPLEPVTLGEGRTRLSFRVPRGWLEIRNAENERKWKQRGYPNDTFVLRVEQVVTQRETVAALKEELLDDLFREEDQAEVVEEGADRVHYTYLDDGGRKRYVFVRWLDLDSGPAGAGEADVEVAVSGREADADGAAELLRRVSDGMRRG